MCGRYGLFGDGVALAELFGFDLVEMPYDYRPRWNVAPTTPVLTLRNIEDSRKPDLMRWGLIPPWQKPEAPIRRPLINARAETIAERPTFRTPFARQRCLVIADGFYEWRRSASTRTPMWIHQSDEQPFAFAGVWSRWRGPDGPIESCAIITCEPNELMSPIHNRMPVILPSASYDDWLGEGSPEELLLDLIEPSEWPDFTTRQVSSQVNSVRNDGPSLIEAATVI